MLAWRRLKRQPSATARAALADRLCSDCARIADGIQFAREWLTLDSVILDTETTGLDASHDDVIQLSVVNLRGEVLLDTFIKPRQLIVEEVVFVDDAPYGAEDGGVKPTAFAINGICNAMVENVPTFGEV